MTLNKYFFHYRNQNFMIYAKDIPDAFIPWKRLLMKHDIDQPEFENSLIEGSKEILDNHCILVGNSVSTQEIKQILNSGKKNPVVNQIPKERKYVPAPVEIAKIIEEGIEVTEDQAFGDGWKDLPPVTVKRGRGRPPGSKNKTTSIQNYIEE